MNRDDVSLIINGLDVKVPKGTTILKAAENLGIAIPALCHHKELSPSGSCRLCIVEIFRRDRKDRPGRIDAACVCPAEEGMSVETDSPRVRRERKEILSLLLSRAPRSEKIIQLARQHGVDDSPYKAADGGKSNCIVCGLCIRVCNELIGALAIGTAFRGVEKQVVSPYGIAADLCIGCLACEAVCPTGVISFVLRDNVLEKEDWQVKLPLIRCEQCGGVVGAQRQWERLRSLIPVGETVLRLCPACRRKSSYINSVNKHQSLRG